MLRNLALRLHLLDFVQIFLNFKLLHLLLEDNLVLEQLMSRHGFLASLLTATRVLWLWFWLRLLQWLRWSWGCLVRKRIRHGFAGRLVE